MIEGGNLQFRSNKFHISLLIEYFVFFYFNISLDWIDVFNCNLVNINIMRNLKEQKKIK